MFNKVLHALTNRTGPFGDPRFVADPRFRPAQLPARSQALREKLYLNSPHPYYLRAYTSFLEAHPDIHYLLTDDQRTYRSADFGPPRVHCAGGAFISNPSSSSRFLNLAPTALPVELGYSVSFATPQRVHIQGLTTGLSVETGCHITTRTQAVQTQETVVIPAVTQQVIIDVPAVYETVQVPDPPVPVTSPVAGWQASYYRGTTLTDLVFQRADLNIDFDWGSLLPGWPVGKDGETPLPPEIPREEGWSIRWAGKFTLPATQDYVFHMESDDGARVYVNGVLQLDDWEVHGVSDFSFTVSGTEGQVLDIVVEYFENETPPGTVRFWYEDAPVIIEYNENGDPVYGDPSPIYPDVTHLVTSLVSPGTTHPEQVLVTPATTRVEEQVITPERTVTRNVTKQVVLEQSNILQIQWPAQVPFEGPMYTQQPWVAGARLEIYAEPSAFPLLAAAQLLVEDTYVIERLARFSLVDEFTAEADMSRVVALGLMVLALDNPAVYPEFA